MKIEKNREYGIEIVTVSGHLTQIWAFRKPLSCVLIAFKYFDYVWLFREFSLVASRQKVTMKKLDVEKLRRIEQKKSSL